MSDEKVGLSLRIEREALEEVDRLSGQEGITRTEFIRRAVANLIEEKTSGNTVVLRIRVPYRVYERLLYLQIKGEIIDPYHQVEAMVIEKARDLYEELKEVPPLLSGDASSSRKEV